VGQSDQRAQHHRWLKKAMPSPTPPGGWDCHVHVFTAQAKAVDGHYAPQDHPLERIEAIAAQHGFGHLVLVQPSVYGADNSLMLSALQASGGRHRGVVVVNEPLEDAKLQAWHEAGVRGIRCNLVSPVGNQQTDWNAWAPRLRALGWHVQWYAHADQLQTIVKWQQAHRLPCVLDHVAGMHTRFAQDSKAWRSLRALADAGAWIKLSGWYRLGLVSPYELERLGLPEIMKMFASRCVWGSDWPHTSFASEQAPSYAQVWQPLQHICGVHAQNVLSHNAMQLYA
jgi:predicted TIM-barrel fold metal-dependent hydrolase